MLEKAFPVLAASDPIRIVPLHVPAEVSQPAEGLAASPPPHLTYRGGPLLSSVEIFVVFWGMPWTASPLAAMALAGCGKKQISV